MEKSVVGECYLPMISDWWRQGDNELKKQYLTPLNDPSKWADKYGGSCDNDVHEHFKCLMDTVFGKAFIHETEEGYQTYNCRYTNGKFICGDEYLREWIVYSDKDTQLILNGNAFNIQKGMNVLEVKEVEK